MGNLSADQGRGGKVGFEGEKEVSAKVVEGGGCLRGLSGDGRNVNTAASVGTRSYDPVPVGR